MGREAKINNRLTRKQTVFVNELANGKSATQAALVAYNTNDPNTAKVIASENLTKPNIREALEESLRAGGLSLSVITNNIGELANSKPEKISGDVKLKANIELLRLYGVYPSTKYSNVNINLKGNIKDLNFKEVKEELKVIDSELEEVLKEAIPGTPQTV